MKNVMKRTISFLCVVVLLLTLTPVLTRAEEQTEQQPQQQGSRVIVSLGDSYSSGEGNPDYYDSELSAYERVNSQDWLAHRSKNSWPGQLTLEDNGSTILMSKNRDTYWYFAASSGAETIHLDDERQKKPYNTGGYEGTEYIDKQLDIFDEVARDGRQAEYVTVSIGGNDVQFAGVIKEGLISSTIGCPSILADKLNGIWNEFYKEKGIRSKIRNAYYDINEHAGEQAKIIVAGYPKLLQPGMTLWFSAYAAESINTSVSRFNKEIETLVNSCKADGMKICFVSVEEGFNGHGAYSSDPYILPISFPNDEDLKEDFSFSNLTSASSMHPNAKGMEIYRACVQEKINQIEDLGEASEWPQSTRSNELDVVLVLDASGSMDGRPMEETIDAATSFVNTVLTEESSVGVVAYDTEAMMICRCTKNGDYAKDTIVNLNAGGSTNIDAGLQMAEQMLLQGNAKKKIIILMSDGEPNRGRVGNSLIEYANEIKEKGIDIYTLGFFHNSYGSSTPESLMNDLASEGKYYKVDDADNLIYFFGDIADQVQGTKYIYVRIACPVDVRVEYNGEVLDSTAPNSSQRTSFGTLTFEENSEHIADSTDNRIKVLRLREGANYNIHIEGNGTGQMTYSIGFMNEEGAYEDVREFADVPITPDTVVDTVAERVNTTTLNVDNDGDGEYDETLTQSGESTGGGSSSGGGGSSGSVASGPELGEILLWVGIGIGGLAVIAVVVVLLVKKNKKKADQTENEPGEPE
jgi:Mg-chelatase subunit ChlD/preprotein translocase subunit SecG